MGVDAASAPPRTLNFDEIQNAFNANPSWVNHPGGVWGEDYALIQATRANDLDVVQLCLAWGASLDQPSVEPPNVPPGELALQLEHFDVDQLIQEERARRDDPQRESIARREFWSLDSFINAMNSMVHSHSHLVDFSQAADSLLNPSRDFNVIEPSAVFVCARYNLPAIAHALIYFGAQVPHAAIDIAQQCGCPEVLFVLQHPHQDRFVRPQPQQQQQQQQQAAPLSQGIVYGGGGPQQPGQYGYGQEQDQMAYGYNGGQAVIVHNHEGDGEQSVMRRRRMIFFAVICFSIFFVIVFLFIVLSFALF